MNLQMLGSEWFAARPGGLNRYFEALWAALRRTPGTTVGAAAFGTAPAGGKSLGPAILSLPRRLRASHDWGRLIQDSELVDVHFALYARAALAGMSAARSICHFHGPWAAESIVGGESPLKGWAKKRVEAAVLREVSNVVVLSSQFADVLRRDYGVPGNRISVIPGGVDVDTFTPADNGSSRDKQVVAVRRLEDRMGLDVLIRAWPTVLGRHPDARLLVVGEGSARAKLEALTGSLGLDASVRLVGRQSDGYVVSAYRQSAVSVVSSVALEGFGLIALESLACGTPAVVTRCGGLPGVVAPLSAELVVDAGDPGDLARGIVAVLDGEAPSAADCRRYAERFSWDRVAGDHLDLYSGLA
jgi:glycosyltransferase involved in cell wall biosynthesis